MQETRPLFDRVLLTNDDGIDAPALTCSNTSPRNWHAKCGSSRRRKTRAARRTR